MTVVTNTEHVSAAGIALDFVLNKWGYLTIAFILDTIFFMSIVREILRPKLKNLIYILLFHMGLHPSIIFFDIS